VTYIIQFCLSDSWLKDYPYFCTFVLCASTFKWLATECYSYGDTSKHIPCDSSHRAGSNHTLHTPSRHLPPELSAFFSLPTSIALGTLLDLYDSILVGEPTSTHPVPTLSNCWLKGYPYQGTLVPRASTFQLLATEYNSHADTSRPIPFNSPHPEDSNASCQALSEDLCSG